ncbi:MAG TPA: hypothetical protein VGD07_17415 [Methylomirabilota bacterium]|jgi:hypothetical protein
MKIASPRALDLASPRRRLKTPAAVALWRPEIVLATSITASPTRPAVAVAAPPARPAALRTQLGAAHSLLASLADAQQALGAAAAEARVRAGQADTPREHVSATIAAYRAEAVLDDVLAGAWRRMAALMEARGLR